jgi:two-component system OmpR family response regulator
MDKVRRKVLLIDDDHNIRLVAEIGLELAFEVLTAASGVEGLAIAEAENPDVILLDVKMPGMDGPETLAKLKENPVTAGIPVVFLTASVQTHEMEEYRKLGVAGIIQKPFDPMTMPEELWSMTWGTGENVGTR